MKSIISFLLFLLLNYIVDCSSKAFHSEFSLTNFQELAYDEFNFKQAEHSRQKRSDDSHSITNLNLDSNRLTFHAYNKTFNLVLKRGTNLLSDNFKLEVRYSSHIEYDSNINNFKQNYFTGFVEDEESSSVLVYYESINSSNPLDKPLIYAQIRIKQENNSIDYYYIEPVKSSDSSSLKYVVYKSEDIESSILTNGIFNKTVCNVKHADETSEIPKRKVKRQVVDLKKKKRCSLALVADFKFYENIGNKNVKQTQTYLTNIITRINDIYTQTEWTFAYEEERPIDERRNFGFVIEKIVILANQTTDQNSYNSPTSSKSSDIILEQFSKSEDWTPYCLAHLFTFQDFDGVLGLAYVASPRENSIGGICSRQSAYQKQSVNTGFSSYRSTNFAQKRLTQREAELVTAHEFGHNWGSEHDPLNEQCTPSSGSGGGNYLMYSYLNSGIDRNNVYFSPCSITAISLVLQEKSTCFKEESLVLCGNGKVDEGEDCDSGEKGLNGNDKCCDKNCRFKNDAQCSDENHDCCNNCKIAKSGTRCVSNRNYLECFKDYSECDGISKKCPEYKPIPEGEPCLSFDKGKCDGFGHCLSLCQQGQIKYEPCLCSKPEEKCMICCRVILRDTNQTDCRPYHRVKASSPEYLSKGRVCADGLCNEKNVCVQKVKDYVTRFWKVIQKIDANSFVEFMRRNIVGSVILISLIFWVPISCCVHFCIDKRDKAEQTQVIRAKMREISQSREQQEVLNTNAT